MNLNDAVVLLVSVTLNNGKNVEDVVADKIIALVIDAFFLEAPHV
jgi:hypothetical protein